ncbi:aspartate/glutamate racemase family protein [Polaribacter porphyrae]|uniref:Aspartate racemase n=1 Tax=Polaribacter porphyrae TaxID=1137780 RepID=A0A2S7WRD0_9FLAO|nr:amino acid racemase [Polaribacter porphyrae]PQJ79861.1 hypothetical protein BTO18_12050 [Polaribacter porphyrae]
MVSKKIGICAHSYEGGSLCFITACREGAKLMGSHMHPNILLSAIPMGLSMNAWEPNSYSEIGKYLKNEVNQIANGGEDYFLCPDNTAHIVLEQIIRELPIPGLHIAEVVCQEILKNKWKNVGLLGTKWTMNGTIYANILQKKNIAINTPDEPTKQKINDSIFNELCQGVFNTKTTELFIEAINDLKKRGAECVILGCTEIPLIINTNNSPLLILDSTRLHAKYAVRLALSEVPIPKKGWVREFYEKTLE